jgi:hypothetical protein
MKRTGIICLSNNKVTIMIASLELLCQAHPEWEQYCKQMAEAEHLSAMVWVALQMGLFIARRLVEQELGHRAARPTDWGNCPKCDSRLHAKGWQGRSMQTVVGKID